MLEEYIIGKTIEEIKSDNRFIVESIFNLELYEEFIITDGNETIVCGTNEDNKLIPVIDL